METIEKEIRRWAEGEETKARLFNLRQQIDCLIRMGAPGGAAETKTESAPILQFKALEQEIYDAMALLHILADRVSTHLEATEPDIGGSLASGIVDLARERALALSVEFGEMINHYNEDRRQS